jgi:hypothetical protein
VASDGGAPERQGGGVAAGDGGLPEVRIEAEDLPGGDRADAAAPVFPHDEELRHVALDRRVAVRSGIDQGEADQPAVQPEEQGILVVLAPVGVQRIVGKAAVVLQLTAGRARLVLGEIMHIELDQVGQDLALVRVRGGHLDDGRFAVGHAIGYNDGSAWAT